MRRRLNLGAYVRMPGTPTRILVAAVPLPGTPVIESPNTLPPSVPQPPPVETQRSGALYVPQQPWVTPPANAEPIDPINWATLTAPVSTIIVLDFTVPPGRDGVIKLFGMQVFGAGWTEGTTNLVWRILRDGQAERNYSNILASLGNVGNPAAIGGQAGMRIFEGNRIQVVAINNTIPAGGQQLGARMGGWLYPKTHDDSGW